MPARSSITWKEVIVVVLSVTLAVQQKEFVHKSFGSRTEKKTEEDKQNIGKAFLVHLDENGCTGTLIAKDWILTAAHCCTKLVDRHSKNENGDYDKTFYYSHSHVISKYFGIPKMSRSIQPWREPIGNVLFLK